MLPPVPPWPKACRSEPRRLTLAGLAAEQDADYSDAYAPDVAGLRELAAQLGAGSIPDALLAWLAAASYTVGMLVPGADSLFASARIERSDEPGPARLDAIPGPRQAATGLLEVRARFGYSAASAHLRLRAFVRPAIQGPSRDVLLGQRTDMTNGPTSAIGAVAPEAVAAAVVRWVLDNHPAADILEPDRLTVEAF